VNSIPRLAARLAIAVALVAIPTVATRSHAAAASCPGPAVVTAYPTSSVTVQLFYDSCANTVWSVTSDSQGNGNQEGVYESDVDTAYDTIFAPDDALGGRTVHASVHQTAACGGQYYGYGVITYSNGNANPPDDIPYRTDYYTVNCGY